MTPQVAVRQVYVPLAKQGPCGPCGIRLMGGSAEAQLTFCRSRKVAGTLWK